MRASLGTVPITLPPATLPSCCLWKAVETRARDAVTPGALPQESAIRDFKIPSNRHCGMNIGVRVHSTTSNIDGSTAVFAVIVNLLNPYYFGTNLILF